ncbi:MAG TPA: OmpA family protein [Gemmatimonadales bacterium]|nr:OmpA family protein [Gemmatimonadales bacterium]
MRTYRRRFHPLTRGLWLLCALVLLPLLGSTVEAQQRRYLLELGAGVHRQSFDEATGVESGFGGLGRVGLWLPAHFSVEVEGSFVGSDATDARADTTASISTRVITGSVLYNILIARNAWAHLKLGGGSTNYGDAASRGLISGSSGTLMAGAGLRMGITPDLFARGDLTLTRNSSDTSDVSFTNVGVSLGLSYMLGSKAIPDSDGDGILENKDRCPDTPAGAQVDGTGCPSDSDADGVPDGVDRCANTAPGAEVDATGCTQDSDSDNIPDGLDRCPDTESGVLVDPNGCPRDSDGDAIPDGLDRCSETPKGATVDALGCPGDEDGDGVLDGLDRCPRTPTGTSTNATGCPTTPGAAPQAAPQRAPPPAAPRPEGAAAPGAAAAGAAAAAAPPGNRPAAGAAKGHIAPGVIPDVAFATGSARLLSQSYVPLDSIAQILKADTTVKIEVGAHTDNTGAPSEAERLTNLQAEAVRTYLVTRGVNFQQVQARGYGSAFPLTTDNTPRGRAANRRVEIKLGL